MCSFRRCWDLSWSSMLRLPPKRLTIFWRNIPVLKSHSLLNVHNLEWLTVLTYSRNTDTLCQSAQKLIENLHFFLADRWIWSTICCIFYCNFLENFPLGKCHEQIRTQQFTRRFSHPKYSAHLRLHSYWPNCSFRVSAWLFYNVLLSTIPLRVFFNVTSIVWVPKEVCDSPQPSTYRSISFLRNKIKLSRLL